MDLTDLGDLGGLQVEVSLCFFRKAVIVSCTALFGEYMERFKSPTGSGPHEGAI